jgi:hypothetical protein
MTNVVEFEHSVIPAGMVTDQELINEGRQIVNMRGRVLGDWYNKVKTNKSDAAKIGGEQSGFDQTAHKKTAKQICTEADVKYNTASGYGMVVTEFPTVESQRGFSFSACYKMLPILNELGSEEFFGRFMADAVAGLPYRGVHDPDWAYRGPYCTKDIERVKFYVTRKMLPPSPTEEDIAEEVEVLVEEFSEGVLSTLPKKTQKKALTELRKVLKDQERLLNKAFMAEVDKGIAMKLAEKTREADEHLEYLKTRQADTKKKEEQLTYRLKRVSAFMPRADYKLVLNCLHPDRAPAGYEEKFGKAFIIVKRLEPGVDG